MMLSWIFSIITQQHLVPRDTSEIIQYADLLLNKKNNYTYY